MYKVKKQIGEGTDGQVFEVENIITKKSLALKIIKTKCQSDVNWFRNEIGIQLYVSECP